MSGTSAMPGTSRSSSYNPYTDRTPQPGTHSYRQRYGTWFPTARQRLERGRAVTGTEASAKKSKKPLSPPRLKRSASRSSSRPLLGAGGVLGVEEEFMGFEEEEIFQRGTD